MLSHWLTNKCRTVSGCLLSIFISNKIAPTKCQMMMSHFVCDLDISFVCFFFSRIFCFRSNKNENKTKLIPPILLIWISSSMPHSMSSNFLWLFFRPFFVRSFPLARSWINGKWKCEPKSNNKAHLPQYYYSSVGLLPTYSWWMWK